MGAALEIIIIPALLLLAVVVFGVIGDFSIGTTLAAAVVVFLLAFSLITLLRKEKEWEGPPEEHEEHEGRAARQGKA
jgi:hypothetical protein